MNSHLEDAASIPGREQRAQPQRQLVAIELGPLRTNPLSLPPFRALAPFQCWRGGILARLRERTIASQICAKKPALVDPEKSERSSQEACRQSLPNLSTGCWACGCLSVAISLLPLPPLFPLSCLFPHSSTLAKQANRCYDLLTTSISAQGTSVVCGGSTGSGAPVLCVEVCAASI